MPSERKTQANRRNAALSTGPKTPEGKATVSRNAVKHGLASRLVVLPEENRQDFLDLLAAFRSEFQPATPFEESLVFQLAAGEWRLRRIARIETGLLCDRLDDLRDELDLEAPEPEPDGLPDEDQFRQDTRLLGRVFWRSCSGDTIVKLLRYENSIRRAFYKALQELRLIPRRSGAPLPPRPSEITEQTHPDPDRPPQETTEQSHVHPAPALLPVAEVSSPL